MKMVQKTFILIVISAVCYLSLNLSGNGEIGTSVDIHSGNPETAEQFIRAYTSPFQVTLPENEMTAANNIVYRILKSPTFKTACTATHQKITLFYTTLRYVTHVKYICNTLKKTELLYPFHFFF